MRIAFPFLATLGLWLSLSTAPAAAQQPNNDGFHRRNGQMHILRNGQLRPMTRDSRLPTGTLVTKDGFVVDAQGRRTELREGQGCDLSGKIVAVRQAPNGALALATPAPRPVAVAERADGAPAAGEVRSVFADLFGGRGRGKKLKAKHKGKGWEKAGKHGKKRRKGEGWDD